MTYTLKPGTYQTRDGRKAVVLCDDAPGSWPLVGFISELDRATPASWRANGRLVSSEYTRGADLLPPVQEQQEVVRWITLYRDDDIMDCILTATPTALLPSTWEPVARTRVVLTPGRFDTEDSPSDYDRGWNDALDAVIRSDYRDDASLRAEKKETRP